MQEAWVFIYGEFVKVAVADYSDDPTLVKVYWPGWNGWYELVSTRRIMPATIKDH